MLERKNLPPACLLFIFGGSGDLNYRKLTPALYNLCIDGLMPEKFSIIGIGRTEYTDEDYQQHLFKGIQQFSRRKEQRDGQWNEFAKTISFLKMEAADASSYHAISDCIKSKEKEFGEAPVVIFYLAVAPQLFPVIAKNLQGLPSCANRKSTRIVVEKPFGHDLASAHELNKLLSGIFGEEQIFRIDHYLGKETVQNILAFRFANALFEPVWNRNYIDHIQITASETVGMEKRGEYYERSGAVRDMIQNHILQLLCMMTMEPPLSFDANEVRNKKLDILNAIRRFSKENVHELAVRGQYADGWIKGEQVKSYRKEENVNPESAVETFAALKFYIDNWRWQGVPFYVRTGKRMNAKTTVISVLFRPAPHYSFPKEAAETWRPNRITFSIQPGTDIRLRFQAKRPGNDISLNPVNMVFNYKDFYNGQEPEAYETLLMDVISGDATLFMRADQVEAAWKVIMPIIEAWESRPPVDFPNYSPGSWGPEDTEALIARDGHNWVTLPLPTLDEDQP
jgi:glucose-6-phosphate 1-dehydrogenase